MKNENLVFSALTFETEKGTIEAQRMGAELFLALSEFQVECPTIEKKKKGYGYNYADFTTAVETMKPFLKKHKLGFSQMIEETNKLRTIVFHIETGQWLQSVLIMPAGFELKGMNIYQTDGARNTYYKRYALFSMLGVITAEEDIDAKGPLKQVETKKETPKKPEKSKLNNNQFIQLLGAINAGDITVKDAFNYYDFDDNQKLTLNNL